MSDDVAAVDRVIGARRSIRSFSDEVPSRDDLARVMAAGLAGPYAAAMTVDGVLDRRFFVLPRGGAASIAAREAIRSHARAALASGELSPPLRARLEPVAEGRIIGVGTAPYYVVVAERGAVPDVRQQSLAHALQNMWLMATALGLGLHLVSVTARMADDATFCGVLGLPVGRYALNGCAIGVPAEPTEPRRLPDAAAVTTWLE